VLAAISSPAQEEIIEKVLRARGQWDPPWLKGRPARGPPSAGASACGEDHGEDQGPIDPSPPDEAYLHDPEPPVEI